MSIIKFTFIKNLTPEEVTKICSVEVRDSLRCDMANMSPDEIRELFDDISSKDSEFPDFEEILERGDDFEDDFEDDAEITDEDIETYRQVYEEVNNFPAWATGDDFLRAIDRIIESTGIDNVGLWWDVIEACLAARVGSSLNYLEI